MAEHCPKCNFINPYGAQICGDCGAVLITPKPDEGVMKEGRHDIKWDSIGLVKADKRKNRPMVSILALILFLYGSITIMISLAQWFKPVHGMGFILATSHLYPLLMGCFLGLFTIILSYGIYRFRTWSLILFYFVWVGLQALIFFLLWAGWWRPGWFSARTQVYFSMIILAGVVLIPFVLNLRGGLKGEKR